MKKEVEEKNKIKIIFMSILILIILVSLAYFCFNMLKAKSDYTYTIKLLKSNIYTPAHSIDYSVSYVGINDRKYDNPYRTNYSINGHKATLYFKYSKPDPCTNVKYVVFKNNSDISIIPHIIPSYGGGQCVQMQGADLVEINIILPTGEYRIFTRDTWGMTPMTQLNRTLIIPQ